MVKTTFIECSSLMNQDTLHGLLWSTIVNICSRWLSLRSVLRKAHLQFGQCTFLRDGAAFVTKTDRYFQLILVAECFYITTVMFIKLALGIFFMRVSIDKRHKAFTIGGSHSVHKLRNGISPLCHLPVRSVSRAHSLYTTDASKSMCAQKCEFSNELHSCHYYCCHRLDVWDSTLFIIRQLRMPLRAKVIVVLLLVLAAV